MPWKSALLVLAVLVGHATASFGDELTQIVQQDLTAMGYDTGGTDGTLTTKTIIAVSKFQSEHSMEVTGEITPQLAGVIKANMSNHGGTAAAPSAPAAVSPEQAQADLKARQEACLQEKVATAERNARLKSGFGKLFSAFSRTASQYGAGDTVAEVNSTVNEATSIDATITDLEGAAKDLGISQSDIDECKNP